MGLTTFAVDGWTGYLGYPWTTDAYGCDWHVTAETGWRGSPGARFDRTNRARRDGEVDPRQSWLGGRVVVLEGTVTAPTHAQLATGMERFAAVLADGTLKPLLVSEDGVSRLAYVRRSDSADIEYTSALTAHWALTMVAPDPLKYATDEFGGGLIMATTGLPAAAVGLVVPAAVPWVISQGGTEGVFVVDNTGSAPTRPVFTIEGPVVDPRIEHATTGRVLAFDIELGADDTLVVTPDDGTVILNGASNRRGYLAAGSSPVSSVLFPAGINEVSYRALSSTGGSILTATFRPAYW